MRHPSPLTLATLLTTLIIRSEHGPDQTLLARHVWPWARLQALQHDSHNCVRCAEFADFDNNVEM